MLQADKTNRKELVLAYGAWLAICFIWGTTYLAIRVAVRTMPDAWMAGVRFAISGGLLLIILRARGHRFPPVRDWRHLAFIGISLVGFGNWLVVWAEKTVPSGPAALNVAVTPFWIAGLESLLGKKMNRTVEGWSVAKILGLIVGFSGVCLLMLPHLTGTWNPDYVIGIVVLQVACVFWAIGSLYSKYKKLESSPLMNASMEMLFGGFFLCIIAFFKGDFGHVRYDQSSLIAFIYLIVVGGMIGFACFIYALDKLPNSIVSLYAYINPLIAVWLGWLILHEEVTWHTLAATAVILSGIWLVRRTAKDAKDAK